MKRLIYLLSLLGLLLCRTCYSTDHHGNVVDNQPIASSFSTESFINSLRPTERRLQSCGQVLATLTRDQVKSLVNGVFKANSFSLNYFERLFLRLTIVGAVQHGIQVRVVCGQCDGDYSGCQSNDYGSGATFSGLVIAPLDSNNKILATTMVPVIQTHSTRTNTQPSIEWQGASTTLETLSNVLVSAIQGTVNIAPDYMGYGTSNGVDYRAYLIRKSYVTSVLPLIGATRKWLENATDCTSALAKGVVVYGYSEGGYAAVAVAEAIKSELGLDIIRVEAGGGPYDLTTTMLKALARMDAGNYPLDKRYFLSLVGAAQSSTYTDTPLYGQNVLKSSVRDAIVKQVNSAASKSDLLSSIPSNDPSYIIADDIVAFLRAANAAGDTDPCGTSSTIARSSRIKLLCETLNAQDLTADIVSANYPIRLCQSKSDRVVDYTNVPAGVETKWVGGDHDAAGEKCILAALTWFTKLDFNLYNIVDQTLSSCNRRDRRVLEDNEIPASRVEHVGNVE